MKSILNLLIFVLIMFGSSQTYSQEKKLKEKSTFSTSEKRANYYVEKLNLNDEQAQKFEAINKAYKKNISDLKIKSKSKKSVNKLKALEQKRDNEIKDILSEDQYEKFLKLRRNDRNKLKTLIRKSNKQ